MTAWSKFFVFLGVTVGLLVVGGFAWVLYAVSQINENMQ